MVANARGMIIPYVLSYVKNKWLWSLVLFSAPWFFFFNQHPQFICWMWIKVMPWIHQTAGVQHSQTQNDLARPNIFSLSFGQIYTHVVNKWKYIRKESCRGWLFWAAFIAFLLHTASVVWFVERLKWGWLVEQRVTLDLQTLLNHTHSCPAGAAH